MSTNFQSGIEQSYFPAAIPQSPSALLAAGYLSVALLAALHPDARAFGNSSSPFKPDNDISIGAGAPQSELNAPIAITQDSPANALYIRVDGLGRAILANVENYQNPMNAIAATTRGSGAAIAGTNTSINGPAGRFYLSAQGSEQSAVYAFTVGRGNGVTGIVSSEYPGGESYGVFGRNNSTPGWGTGIRGLGGSTGVYGTGDSIGVHGRGATGVYGTAIGNGAGVSASSFSGIGVDAHSLHGTGANITSDLGDALVATASSNSHYAGRFNGNVTISAGLYVGGIYYSSDRHLKEDLQPVHGPSVLDRLSDLNISSWVFKDKPDVRHIGPMAQDFHQAFSVGADSRHISAGDMAGVTLAAVKELNDKIRARDEEMEQLRLALREMRAEMRASSGSQACLITAGHY
jgi:hypothetical protein